MKPTAIAICRVSTPEQKLNNSLTRQEEAVKKAATELDVEIVRWWSGDASSKVGKNFKRKDLREAEAYCKSNRRVKFLLVDEVDRFMRSTAEMFYWMITFKEIGVQVYFASNPELNTDDAKSRLLLSLDGFKSEGSNEERQFKSIHGHETAIREGRYTFPPLPGYKTSDRPGVHLPRPETYKYMQQALQDVLSRLYTPQEALQRLFETPFGNYHARWRMDKFRRYATDPFYAGIIVKDLQVKERNECGLHQAMITVAEHEELVRVFAGKTKLRGPKKQYNPEFPMNKVMTCADCGDDIKFTGSIKNNGYAKKNTKYYYKYHCRGCGKSYHRAEVHDKITERLNEVQYTGEQRQELIEALTVVWGKKQQDKLQQADGLRKRLEKLNETKSKLIIELTNTEADFRDDIKQAISATKSDISDTEAMLDAISGLGDDLLQFAKFGLEYTNQLSNDWWELSHDERVRCQELIFPGGISFNAEKKVGTQQLSPIYSLEPNKKALRVNRKALMEELAGTAPASAGLFS